METLRAQISPPEPLGDADARPSRSVIVLAAMLLVCALSGRAVYLLQPPNSDTAIFVYMGKLIAGGGRMGVDLVDNKLPSVGLLMSLPYKLIGPHWWGYTLLGLLMTMTASVVLTRAAVRCFGRHALIPVLVGSAVWLNIPPMVYGLLQLETIQVFLIAFAAAAGMELLVRGTLRHALIAGLCTGLAMWAKPTAGAIGPALVLAIAITSVWTIRRRLAAFGMLALGALIPLALCAALVMHNGMADALPQTITQLRDYSANSTARWADAVKPVFVAAVLLFPLLVLGWVFRRDKIDDAATERPGGASDAPSKDQGNALRSLRTFVIAWFVMEMLAVIAQRRMYAYHFLVLAPPAAMLLALVARRLRVVSLGFALGPAALMCALWAGEIAQMPNDQKRMESVIQYVDAKAKPGDAIWLDEYPRLMVETDLEPGSRVPLIVLFANSDAAPEHFSKIILDDLAQRQPEWIVLYHDVEKYIDYYRHHMVEIAEFPQRGENFAAAWRAIDRYARQHYTLETRVDRMDILRRKETAPALSHAAD